MDEWMSKSYCKFNNYIDDFRTLFSSTWLERIENTLPSNLQSSLFGTIYCTIDVLQVLCLAASETWFLASSLWSRIVQSAGCVRAAKRVLYSTHSHWVREGFQEKVMAKCSLNTWNLWWRGRFWMYLVLPRPKLQLRKVASLSFSVSTVLTAFI